MHDTYRSFNGIPRYYCQSCAKEMPRKDRKLIIFGVNKIFVCENCAKGKIIVEGDNRIKNVRVI